MYEHLVDIRLRRGRSFTHRRCGTHDSAGLRGENLWMAETISWHRSCLGDDQRDDEPRCRARVKWHGDAASGSVVRGGGAVEHPRGSRGVRSRRGRRRGATLGGGPRGRRRLFHGGRWSDRHRQAGQRSASMAGRASRAESPAHHGRDSGRGPVRDPRERARIGADQSSPASAVIFSITSPMMLLGVEAPAVSPMVTRPSGNHSVATASATFPVEGSPTGR